MLVEYPRVEDALAKQAKTSEKFRENVFRSFTTIKAVFESQGARIEGVEDRQDRIEEDQGRLKQLCDYNFKTGSDHLQYLLNSNEHCFGLLEAAGEHLNYLSGAIKTLKDKMDEEVLKKDVKLRNFCDLTTQELKALSSRLESVESSERQRQQVTIPHKWRTVKDSLIWRVGSSRLG
jgi:hypothetical protein